jgi:hypothetical protein
VIHWVWRCFPRVTLTAEEREQVTAVVSKGRAAAPALTHARILLKADEVAGRALRLTTLDAPSKHAGFL